MAKLVGILLGYVAIFFVVWNGLDYLNATFIQKVPFFMEMRHNVVMPIVAGVLFFMIKHIFPMMRKK